MGRRHVDTLTRRMGLAAIYQDERPPALQVLRMQPTTEASVTSRNLRLSLFA